MTKFKFYVNNFLVLYINYAKGKGGICIKLAGIELSQQCAILPYGMKYLRSRGKDVPGAAIASLDYLARRARQLDFDGLQLTFPYRPFGRVSQLDRNVDRKVDALVAEFGVDKVSAHLPIVPLHTQDGIAEFTAGLEYVLARGVKRVVAHPVETDKGWPWEKKIPIDYKLSLVNLGSILNDYRRENLKIGIENLTGSIQKCRHPTDFEHLFGRKKNLTVGAWIDVCHATNSGFMADNLVKRYLDREQLIGAHINDTIVIGGKDKHCALGFGSARLEQAMLLIYGSGATMTLEVDDKDVEPSRNWLVNWITADR